MTNMLQNIHLLKAATFATIVISSLAIGLTGCYEESEPEPEPEEVEVHIPTPEEIAAEIRPILEPMRFLVTEQGHGHGWGEDGSGAPGMLSDADEKKVLDGLRQAKLKHQATEYGQGGLAIISHEIADIIKKARDTERWKLVQGAIKAYKILVPGTTKWDRLDETARLYRLRPTVRVRGFFDDNETGDTYAFLTVILKEPKGETHDVQARVGEEFFNLRLQEIVGKKNGVVLEYLLIPGDTWKLPYPPV